jgi:AcrR family transcriptional regulator
MAKKYQLKQRAEKQEETRKRIVGATLELHGKLGPAHTSIKAIAKRAGVERPTVYRHFPTLDDLFHACSSLHWTENPLPDRKPWLRIEDPESRMRRGLTELYGYYTQHELLLWNIQRDLEDHPEMRKFAAPAMKHLGLIAETIAGGWKFRGRRQKLLRAAVAHAADFFTWRSLRRQGLDNDAAAEMMLTLARNIQVR